MPNLNKVMLMGNLTRDPEVRYTPKGTAVTDIGLAINRSYTLDDGERREETTFVDITFWGRQAEVLGEYMKKGRPLFVEGRLNLDSWEDKNTGQQRSRLKIVGENFQFLGGRNDSDGGSGGGYSGGGGTYSGGGERSGESASSPPSQSQALPQPQSAPSEEEDEDIPF